MDLGALIGSISASQAFSRDHLVPALEGLSWAVSRGHQELSHGTCGTFHAWSPAAVHLVLAKSSEPETALAILSSVVNVTAVVVRVLKQPLVTWRHQLLYRFVECVAQNGGESRYAAIMRRLDVFPFAVLREAAARGWTRTVRRWYARVDSRAVSCSIIDAAVASRYRTLAYLLARNREWPDADFALWHAILSASGEVIRLLLEHGATYRGALIAGISRWRHGNRELEFCTRCRALLGAAGQPPNEFLGSAWCLASMVGPAWGVEYLSRLMRGGVGAEEQAGEDYAIVRRYTP